MSGSPVHQRRWGPPPNVPGAAFAPHAWETARLWVPSSSCSLHTKACSLQLPPHVRTWLPTRLLSALIALVDASTHFTRKQISAMLRRSCAWRCQASWATADGRLSVHHPSALQHLRPESSRNMLNIWLCAFHPSECSSNYSECGPTSGSLLLHPSFWHFVLHQVARWPNLRVSVSGGRHCVFGTLRRELRLFPGGLWCIHCFPWCSLKDRTWRMGRTWKCREPHSAGSWISTAGRSCSHSAVVALLQPRFSVYPVDHTAACDVQQSQQGCAEHHLTQW